MIIVHVVEPFAAGVAVFVKYLTESMPDDVHIIIHGERKEVMSAEAVKSTFRNANIEFISWRSAQRSISLSKDFKAFRELYVILKKLKAEGRVDSVHLHSSKSGLLGRIACRILKLQNVFYTPNGAPFLSGKTAFSRYIYRAVEKFGNLIGGKVICCSVSEMDAYSQLGIQATCVNNGIKMDEKARIGAPKNDDKFRIVTTGRIVNQKNPEFFNSIASYFSGFDQFEFIWAGDGADRNALTSSNITITGWLPEKEIKKLVVGSDLYLSTSLYEGLSFGVLEALTLKKPVLLSHCIGNMDVVKNGINGDLFETKMDAVTKILRYHTNREMLSVMGDFSKSICDTEFNVKKNFTIYRKLYENILDVSPENKWAFA